MKFQNNLTAPNVGHTFAFSKSGALAVATGKHRIYNITGATLTIKAVIAALGTSGSTTTTIDVNKNGTTIYTTQGNRPAITSGNNASSKSTNMDVTSLADGDYLTVDIDGAGTGAEDLTVTIVVV